MSKILSKYKIILYKLFIQNVQTNLSLSFSERNLLSALFMVYCIAISMILILIEIFIIYFINNNFNVI